MLARSRRIFLKNGIEFETPLLVPGFSSMAMRQLPQETTDRKVELAPCSILHTRIHTDLIHEALLVSSYDIHYGLLSDNKSFNHGFQSSRYSNPRFLYIDSGWYEKQKNSQGALLVDSQGHQLEWDEKSYNKTIDALDSNIRAVVVSFDHDGAYPEQIAHAQDSSGHRPEFTITILLKAPKGSQFHEFEGLSQKDASDLRAFEIIGVTEKELGDTILNRLTNLANFRSILDSAKVDAPIHVFGGLDPLYTPLLYAAGAEIFDGLGWLRYAYRDGVAMHPDAGALHKSPDQPMSTSMTQVQFDNLEKIRTLGDTLKVFYAKKDWEIFPFTFKRLKEVHQIFEANLEMNYGR